MRRPLARLADDAPGRARARPRRQSRRRGASAGFAVLLLISLPSCGSGSGPTSPNPPQPPPGISFRVAVTPTPTDSISLAFAGSTTESITLLLVANDVDSLYGYGLDLPFDPEVLSFAAFQQEGFLEGEGINVVTEVAENPTGRLIIGQTRVGEVQGVSGFGGLLSLTFNAVANGSTPTSPQAGAAFDAAGNQQTTLFLGGTVTVNR